MSEVVLNATIRSAVGRISAKAARRAGLVPGIFYLHTEKNIPIEVKALDLRPLVYTGETHIVDLRLSDGSAEKCILRDVQFDPVTDRITHFDLMGFVAGEKMRIEVPIVLQGTAAGIRAGGALNHILHRVEIECLPAKLPEHISVDISHMEIGDVLTVGDLVVPDVEFLVDLDVPVATITHARVEAAPAPVEVEEVKEPEVIGRGKGEEGEAEG